MSRYSNFFMFICGPQFVSLFWTVRPAPVPVNSSSPALTTKDTRRDVERDTDESVASTVEDDPTAEGKHFQQGIDHYLSRDEGVDLLGRAVSSNQESWTSMGN